MRHTLMTLLAAATLALPALAQTQTQTQPAPAMVDGEVRKVDASSQKITIRHGDIPSLKMPAMTMVFRAPDADLKALKPGDKIRFRAEDAGGGALVARDIQPAAR